MLSWVLDFLRPIRRSDPVLGELRFLRSGRMWEGAVEFGPTNSEVELIFYVSPLGPTEEHRRFFLALVDAYATLIPEVLRLLKQGEYPPEGEVNLVAINLPSVFDPEPEWELTFEDSVPLQFDVTMVGWRPVSVLEGM